MNLTSAMFEGLRSALIEGDPGRSLVPAQDLGQWNGEPGVFTRRPVPQDAEDPICIINPPIAIGDMDGLTSLRPVWNGTIAFYGKKGAPGSPEDQTRTVESIADQTFELFHRQKQQLSVEGFSVIDVVASGPIAGPVDDDKQVARLVGIRVRLRRN